MRRLRSHLLSAAAVLLSLVPAIAQEPIKPPGTAQARWPQFRGPNGSGLAQDAKQLPVHLGRKGHLLWKTPLLPGHSSPCVWDEHIFLTTYDRKAQRLETLCIARSDGRILWRRTAQCETIEKVHRVSSPAAPTPATDGERVFVYFGSYGLLCYDFEGHEQWNKPMPIPKLPFGSGTSPMLAGDLLILNSQGTGSHLLAVDRQTGQTVWKKNSPRGYSVPVLWRRADVKELIVPSQGQLTAYDLDGTVRWSIGRLPSAAYTTPVTGAGLLFVNFTEATGDPDHWIKFPAFESLAKEHDKNKDGLLALEELPSDFVIYDRGVGMPGKRGGDITLQRGFSRVDVNKDGKIDEGEWKRLIEYATRFRNALLAIRPGGHGNITQSHVVWTEKRFLPEIPSPLYYQGRLYLVKRGGIVSCFEANKGKLLYQKRLGVDGSYYSSPVAGDGKVYIASESGVVVVFKAGDSLNVLAKNDLGEQIMATPAIVDGKLYVRTERHLYAFGE